METHSSILAWRIPWTEEPGRLQSIGWQRVRHDYHKTYKFLRVYIMSQQYFQCYCQLQVYFIQQIVNYPIRDMCFINSSNPQANCNLRVDHLEVISAFEYSEFFIIWSQPVQTYSQIDPFTVPRVLGLFTSLRLPDSGETVSPSCQFLESLVVQYSLVPACIY